MVTTILTIDPGEATGISYGFFDPEIQYVRDGYWLVSGGAQGLKVFLVWFLQEFGQPDHSVIERFVPDGSAGARMTVATRCEGVALALLDNLEYQLRTDKTWGGNPIAQNDETLKRLGLWVTGDEVEWEDGRDVNDSALHVIAWLRKRGHRPTLRAITSHS